MVRLNSRTFLWTMGVFFAALGSLMLIVPHQYASPIYATVQVALPYWGIGFVTAGWALLLAGGVILERAVVRGVLLIAASVLAAFVGVLVQANGLAAMGVYGFLILALVLVALLPSTTQAQPDVLPLMIAANHLFTGTVVMITVQQVAPIYAPLPFPVVWLGVAFLLGGVALAAAQFQRQISPGWQWLAHGLGALPMAMFFFWIAWPVRLWPALLYYGLFGAVVLVLPWVGPRMQQVVVGSLRARPSWHWPCCHWWRVWRSSPIVMNDWRRRRRCSSSVCRRLGLPPR